MITTFADAKKLASDLSHNLYYDTDFTHETFRVFLDSLPPILHVYIQAAFNEDKLNGLVTIYFDDFKYRPICIVFSSTWIYTTYFFKIRRVPLRMTLDYTKFLPERLPF